MNAEDHSYKQMIAGRDEYIREMREEATQKGVKITEWEIEEVEMAFERGFTLGFCAASHDPKDVKGCLN